MSTFVGVYLICDIAILFHKQLTYGWRL